MLNNYCTQWSNSRAAGCNSRAAENCGGKPVLGKKHMKHHESNQRSGQRVQKFIEQVHNAASRIASPRSDSVFVGQCLSVVHCPPAESERQKPNCEVEPLGTGGDTHTHTKKSVLVTPNARTGPSLTPNGTSIAHPFAGESVDWADGHVSRCHSAHPKNCVVSSSKGVARVYHGFTIHEV